MRAAPVTSTLLLLLVSSLVPIAVRAAAAPSTSAPPDAVQLEPIVVEGRTADGVAVDRLPPLLRPAVANLDLPRSENDALPFTIYDRAQISRSGVVDLNDFLQRSMLLGDPTTPIADSGGGFSSFGSGNSNLNLRGFGAGETVVLVNGRRMPEIVTSGIETAPPPPDLSFIPLSLVDRVEVLPTSSSALYAGNAVGGVINIILRPDADTSATEVTTTYTNAVGGFDAPQSSLAINHGQPLLGGKLRVRLSANFTQSTPATEADLGYLQRRDLPPGALDAPIHRATPNVRSTDLSPLFGPGTSAVTSVAPGADGTGGVGAFAGRHGMRNLEFFDPPGRAATSPDSADFPYGRRQQRTIGRGSATWDATPRLQIGFDGVYARSITQRGLSVIRGNLTMDATAPLNPFGQDIVVTLNETAPLLGRDYNEGRVEFASAVVGAILQLPADWRIALDTQYATNRTTYRGLAGADPERWQRLVDTGRYQPLRDTQVHEPPQEFYDEVLIYRGQRAAFVTLGEYQTLDVGIRAIKEHLRTPTGEGLMQLGVDYRRNELAAFHDELRYGDGSLAGDPVAWRGRSLQRYSAFGEVQAPLLPAHWLPAGIEQTAADLAVRYIAGDTSSETNIAPTLGLKVDFNSGVSLRGSVSTSNRFPTPSMSRRALFATPRVPGSVIDHTPVFDPVPDERYSVDVIEGFNLNLRAEAALTQSVGVIVQGGDQQRFRAALDFVDTRKSGELVFLDAQTVLNLESVFPERVLRTPASSATPGRVTAVVTGTVNMASRHAQSWHGTVDYSWDKFFGGRLDLYGRLVHYVRFEQQVLADSPPVDQLRAPDGGAPGLLRHRMTFGGSWSTRTVGFGIDTHYYSTRALPLVEWRSQGDDQIDAHWQLDAFLQSELGRWLPWKETRFGLRGQVRVDNVFNAAFPRYVNAASGIGVQPYGDWRGRTYSLSVTATY